MRDASTCFRLVEPLTLARCERPEDDPHHDPLGDVPMRDRHPFDPAPPCEETS